MPVERDPMEDELLTSLEELAQKADVLTHWEDLVYEGVKAIPQSGYPWIISIYFFKNSRFCSAEALPDPTKFIRREGEPEKQAIRKRNSVQEVEYNAVTRVAVYMFLMTFSQKGFNKLQNYQERLRI